MKPIKFRPYNAIFAENQPEYLSLPAHRDENGVVTSCFKLTLFERIHLFLTGKLYLQVLTFNKPLQPQLPSVHNPLN